MAITIEGLNSLNFRIRWARFIEEINLTAIVFQYDWKSESPLYGGLATIHHGVVEITESRTQTVVDIMRGLHEFPIEPPRTLMTLHMELFDTWLVDSVEAFYEQRQWERARGKLAPPQQLLEPQK